MNQVDSVLERAMASAEAAEVLFEESEEHEASFENNKLKCVITRQGRGLGLRVIRDGRIGFSSTTDLSKLDKLVSDALASAAFGQEARFEFPRRVDPGSVAVFDPRLAGHDIRDAVDTAAGAIDAVLAGAPDVHCCADIGKTLSRMRLVNSQGLDVECEFSDYGVDLYALRVQGESLIGIDEGDHFRELKGDPQEHARTILDKLGRSERETTLKTGTYPVVFTSKAVEVLLGTFLSGTNGKLVQKGASPLVGKIGEALLDERVDLFDDPTLDFAPGSAPVDAEGVRCERMPLFEGGVLRNYVFDLQTAGMMGAHAAGRGMRGFSSQPAPGHTNIVVRPGGMSLTDMLGGMKRGLVVDQVLGEGQSNVLAGEFSVNLDLAFLVEGGEFVGRVKDCMISGNVFAVFNHIVDLGVEPHWHGSVCAPHILFQSMNVAGAG